MSSRFMQSALAISCALLISTQELRAQGTTLVSRPAGGGVANDWSQEACISSDGRFVAFTSRADNLVPGDTNDNQDIFVCELATGAVERVSVDSFGVEGDQGSFAPAISADGRFIAFSSFATNLVPGDTNGWIDLFVHDRATGTTERVDVDAAGNQISAGAFNASLSADGRFVAFDSPDPGLVPDDHNGFNDVFVKDRSDGSIERVNVSSTGDEGDFGGGVPAISADGRFVAFSSSSTNLVAGDTNRVDDVFVFDRVARTAERVSFRPSGGQAIEQCYSQSISADGRLVAFIGNPDARYVGSLSINDAYVHDRATGVTELVSVDSFGQQASADTSVASISADGRFVAFASPSDNLVGGDGNGSLDVFVHDRTTGLTQCASVNPSRSPSLLGWSGTSRASISSDGALVAFFSDAEDLVAGDTNGVSDVFVRQRLPILATSVNYGDGVGGLAGVPLFAAEQAPVLGDSISIYLESSTLDYSVAALFIGTEPAAIPTWGGELLVVPIVTQLIGLSPWGTQILGRVPDDGALEGLVAGLQAVEIDPWAPRGISMTRGLELVLGR